MIAYNFRTETGEYVGCRELRKNPLNPEEYLAHNQDTETLTAPPETKDSEAAVWDGKAWFMI